MKQAPRLLRPTLRGAASLVFGLVLFIVASGFLAPSHLKGQTASPGRGSLNPTPTPGPSATKEKAGIPAKTTGSIKGRVVSDDGQPLPHATVFLSGKTGRAASRPLPPASSDESGKFAFNDLEPGLYGMRAYLPGYATADNEGPDKLLGNTYRLGDTATIRLIKGGVITGTVTNADGEPLVAATVRANRVRSLDGNVALPLDFFFTNEYQTDDRGVYRIYSVPPGIYTVSAGGGRRWSWLPPTAYDVDVPTYFRSATLDTAEEVTVRPGQELTGVDIRHRGERGHSISGTVVQPQGGKPGVFAIGLNLSHASTGTSAGNTVTTGTTNESSFSFDGVADGEYDLKASRETAEDDGGITPSQRVIVRGADVTGLKLTLVPFASVSGILTLEPALETLASCKEKRRSLLPQETLVVANRNNVPEKARSAIPQRREVSPDDSGAFKIRSLEQGRYQLEAIPRDDNWYVREMILPTSPATASAASGRQGSSREGSTAAPSPVDAVELKSGQQLTGLKIVVTEGAASLSGRLVPATDAAPPAFTSLRLHLIPAARELFDNPLRYYETALASDGTFLLRNLAPGRYTVIAREAEPAALTSPVASSAAGRARLRREVKATSTAVTLQPCEHLTGHDVTLN